MAKASAGHFCIGFVLVNVPVRMSIDVFAAHVFQAISSMWLAEKYFGGWDLVYYLEEIVSNHELDRVTIY